MVLRGFMVRIQARAANEARENFEGHVRRFSGDSFLIQGGKKRSRYNEAIEWKSANN